MTNNHAILNRTHARARWLAHPVGGISLIVCVVLLAFASRASAGYALPAPPAGFGGSPGSWTMTPPANAPTIGGGAPAANGPLFRGPAPALGGASGAAEGVAYRVGGGGARVLAGRAVAGLIPGVGLALTAAWLASYCFELRGGQWVRTCFADASPSDGYMYSPTNADPWFPTRKGACDQAVVLQSQAAGYTNYTAWSGEVIASGADAGNCLVRAKTPGGDPFSTVWQVRRKTSTCPVGWYVTPAGCTQQLQPQPVTPEQIVEEMAPKPLPSTLPGGVPYPLDPSVPFIFNPTPGTDPVAQPLRVPQGNPVPIPDTNPQQYRQPVTRFTPAPTPAEPWRMDVRPEDLTSTSPTGLTQPETVTSSSPGGKPPEKFDLCAEHPDVLACQKIDFDTPDGEIPKSTKQITFQEESVFGGGSCPADRVMTLHNGQTVKAWDWAQACQLMLPIRAMVMTLATFAAFLIVMPGIGGRST